MIKDKIANDIYLLSMNVENILFESMWDLPEGVSLNSYIVKGEKTAIIDGVIGWDGVPETLYEHLEACNVNPMDIDYLIVNHMEPDHAGWIENFKEIKKDFTVVISKKGEAILRSYYGDELNILVVNEGDTLDLGNGKVLSFHMIPNVHWPETMMTLETSTKTLFTCDLYGSFGTLNERFFDELMTKEDKEFFEEEGLRYFSNVLATFSPMVKRAVAKTRELGVALIAPGHGPLYKNPESIMQDYERYCDYAKGPAKKEITILWGSMYGETGRTVEFAENHFLSKGIKVNNLQLPQASESDVVTSVFKSSIVLVAAPTYEYKMFPPVAHALDEIGRKKISGKKAMYFGSYGWNSGAKREFENIIDNYKMKWDIHDLIEFNGRACDNMYISIQNSLDELIKDFI